MGLNCSSYSETRSRVRGQRRRLGCIMWQLYFPVYINLENSQPREELRSFNQSQTGPLLRAIAIPTFFFVPDSVREEKKEVSSVNGYSEYNNVIGLQRFLRNLIAK